MQTHTTIAALRAELAARRAAGRTVGLVPTMGYLHDGHLSLIERAAADCDEVVVTIFVNPLQFAAGEDLSAYPRDPEGDSAKAQSAGSTLLFMPPLEEMYPEPMLTTVTVDEVATGMEGGSRPTHFAGVATVVAKLFAIVGECRAYFGDKDYQQLAVVRRMALDLSFPVEVIGCPIVREADGLAMSSRNVYMSAEHRAAAPVLRRALDAGLAAIGAGERSADRVREVMRQVIEAEPLAELDYVEVADPATLRPVDEATPEVRLFVAARLGAARLIDNASASEPPFGGGAA